VFALLTPCSRAGCAHFGSVRLPPRAASPSVSLWIFAAPCGVAHGVSTRYRRPSSAASRRDLTRRHVRPMMGSKHLLLQRVPSETRNISHLEGVLAMKPASARFLER